MLAAILSRILAAMHVNTGCEAHLNTVDPRYLYFGYLE